jgi:hypothetical protein
MLTVTRWSEFMGGRAAAGVRETACACAFAYACAGDARNMRKPFRDQAVRAGAGLSRRQ